MVCTLRRRGCGRHPPRPLGRHTRAIAEAEARGGGTFALWVTGATLGGDPVFRRQTNPDYPNLTVCITPGPFQVAPGWTSTEAPVQLTVAKSTALVSVSLRTQSIEEVSLP